MKELTRCEFSQTELHNLQDMSGLDDTTELIPVHLSATLSSVRCRTTTRSSWQRMPSQHIPHYYYFRCLWPQKHSDWPSRSPARANGAACVRRRADKVLLRGNVLLLALIKSSWVCRACWRNVICFRSDAASAAAATAASPYKKFFSFSFFGGGEIWVWHISWLPQDAAIHQWWLWVCKSVRLLVQIAQFPCG